tara:strand:+ start:384 stop:872 length:489 start_codon:yes stop_codon:yes gene_type:complete
MDQSYDYIFAIDPGKTGAVCIIDPTTGEIEQTKRFSNERDLRNWLMDWSRVSQNVAFAMENIHPSPIQSPSTAGKMMENVGLWTMGIMAFFPRAPFHLVTAQEWQRPLNIKSRDYDARKAELKSIAARTYPDSGVRITLVNCDAILIANYACNNWPVGKLHS